LQVPKLRASRSLLELDPRFKATVAQIRNDTFGWQEFFAPILSNIEGEDYYLVATDFPDYIAIQVGTMTMHNRHSLERNVIKHRVCYDI
jgi:hypothetical protein